jgi:xylulokinase
MIYLGIDSGTQSTKCIAVDVDAGEVLASSQAAYGMVEGLPPGHLEQRPQDWIAAVERTIGECLEALGPRKDEIRGIGVSGQQHGLVVLDHADQPVRPAKLWCDTSTQAECDAFNEAFGGTGGLTALVGNAMLPGYTAPKVLWLKRHEPENFARTRSILLPHDYINFWLTGEKRMEYGDASGTALLDVRTRRWCQPLCDFIDPGLADRLLPPLGSSAKPAGQLRESLRAAWGLPTTPIVSAGGGDNMMGAIGTGNISQGTFTASLGTSGTIYACADKPVVDPAGEVAAFCDSTDRWLPLVCTMNVTVATEQVRNLFGWSVAQLDEGSAQAPAGSGGLLFLPYLTGERTPNLPRGSSVFYGLTSQTMTAPFMARAAMEGATMGLAYGLERFTELGLVPLEVRLTGGGSKSALWRQIAADVFGIETVALATAEGAALGAAIQAAWTDQGRQRATLEALVAKLVRVDEATRVQPDARRRAVYKELCRKQRELTRTLHAEGYL